MLGFDISQTQTYRHFTQDFEDLGRIGSGGFAQVHKVRSRLDNRIYALKIIQIKPSQCKQDIIETIHKFLDQVKILSYLNHKNIIHYHGCWIQTQKSQQINLKSFNQNDLHDHGDDTNVQEEIVMVMEEEFSSSGIQFGQSDNNNSNTNANQQRQRNHHDQDQQFVIENDQTTKETKNYVEIPVDHSPASANIRNTLKVIKIFVLTELGEGNLQQYLYRRNIERQNKLRDEKGLCSEGKGKCAGGKKYQLGQQCSSKGCKTSKLITSPSKKLPSHLNFQPLVPANSSTPNQLSHLPTTDELLTNYRLIIQIIEGLEYLHSKKIIHRDVKLHNIVIDAQKKCKIIDYGLAKKTRMLQSIDYHPKDFSCQNFGLMHLNIPQDERIDEIFSSSVGTRIYSSPQQITSQRYDHRTDIYSLAIVILMFFCDFTTNHQQLSIIEKIRKLDIAFIQCDQRLKNIMIKCLGEEKNRPRLSEIKQIVRQLLRQRYQTRSKKQLPQKTLGEKENVLQKQENIYIMENSKLKKKISKEDYMMMGAYVNQGKKEKQSSTSSNSMSEKNQEEKKKIKEDRIKDLEESSRV